MPALAVQTDLMVQGADGNIVALVEVKNLERLTDEDAAAIRRNLVAHGRADWWSPFFMIVSQDVGYLWEQRSRPPEPMALPTIAFSMAPVVEYYLPSLAGGPRLMGSQLELAVLAWLSDMANGVEARPHEPDNVLADTGLLQLIRGGRVLTEFDLLALYVESNFVLEIVLGQEEVAPAEQLVSAAEQGVIELAIPMFALSEPFSTVTGRARERRRLGTQFNSQVGQLARSAPHQQDVSSLQRIPDTLARIDGREASRLTQTVERILGTARTLETDLAVFREATAFQSRFDLGAQDAVILASVVADLRRRAQPGPHYFANRNRKDFGAPRIQSELQLLGCTVVFSFGDAVGLLGV